jgi:phenylacetate-CoA ligase
MSVGFEIYKRLPVWAQHGSVSAYGLYWHWLRFGSGYNTALRGYLAREHSCVSEWREWQRRSLATLLRTAATCVPYYRNTWGTSERRAALAGELQRLPLLEKEPIRAQPAAFLRDDVNPWPNFTFHTSGSTGTPVRTVWTLREIRSAVALREARSIRWAGASYGLPRATFSGRLAEPDADSTGPFFRYNLVERQVYFSPFHLRPDTAKFYVEALRQHGIQWMTGYAVSYYLLAKMILEQQLSVPKLRAVITTSEKLTAPMREVMERAYGTRVYEEYSTVETSLFASECRLGRLHVSPDVGIVEILRPDGTPCEAGEAGEVVATSLIRQYQLFVRYRLGDMAAWDPEACPCGLSMPVIKEVLGRVEDVVVGMDGRRMVRFHGIFVDQPHIREGQVIQEELDFIRVKVVTSSGFGEADVRSVIQRVQQRLGPQVKVVVEPVPSIPRSSGGKFQAVVSLLPRKGILEAEGTGIVR